MPSSVAHTLRRRPAHHCARDRPCSVLWTRRVVVAALLLRCWMQGRRACCAAGSALLPGANRPASTMHRRRGLLGRALGSDEVQAHMARFASCTTQLVSRSALRPHRCTCEGTHVLTRCFGEATDCASCRQDRRELRGQTPALGTAHPRRCSCTLQCTLSNSACCSCEIAPVAGVRRPGLKCPRGHHVMSTGLQLAARSERKRAPPRGVRKLAGRCALRV